MTDMDSQLDSFAEDGSAAALVLEQLLRPVAGSLVFPPTFAPTQKGQPSDYVIDYIDGRGVTTLDTPGAEANRLEPLFLPGQPLADLVPQIVIKAGNRIQKNLLELGHRAADALVRSVDDQAKRVEVAFERTFFGDHADLAEFAPTSLVFGAWDSRGTGAKLPRLLESRIDAYGVQRRERSAQYFAAVDYVEAGLLDRSTEKKQLDQRSQAGFRDSPSGRQGGGVELLEDSRIVRTVTVHLAGLRQLAAGQDVARGKALRRYVLGLALAAATAPLSLLLRQGCHLVPLKPKSDGHASDAFWRCISNDGSEVNVVLVHKKIAEYARLARDAFYGAKWEQIRETTWTATKMGASAEVKKRDKADEGATKPDQEVAKS